VDCGIDEKHTHTRCELLGSSIYWNLVWDSTHLRPSKVPNLRTEQCYIDKASQFGSGVWEREAFEVFGSRPDTGQHCYIFRFYLVFLCTPDWLTDWLSTLSKVLEKLRVTHSRNFPSFMEPKGSLPSSQEPATGPYREPVESIPHPPNLFLLRPIPILSSHLRLDFRGATSIQVSDQNFLYISYFTHACYMPRPSHPPWLDHPNSTLLSVQVTAYIAVIFLNRPRPLFHNPPFKSTVRFGP